MAGLLIRLCFVSFLLLFLFPDLNTDSTASAAPAPGPNVLPPQSPPSHQAPAGAPPPPPPPANQSPAGAPPPPEPKRSSGGLNGGQKSGIAVGVLAGAGALLLGGMVYKKRRANIRRGRFGRSARTPIL